MEISRSFTKKINLSYYGGNKYETCDFFCSRKVEIPDETDDKAKRNLSQSLSQQCIDDVNKSIKEYKDLIPPFEDKQKI